MSAMAGSPVNRPLHVWHSGVDVKRPSSIRGAMAVLSPVGMYLGGGGGVVTVGMTGLGGERTDWGLRVKQPIVSTMVLRTDRSLKHALG